MSAADMSRVDPMALARARAAATQWKVACGGAVFSVLVCIAAVADASGQRDKALRERDEARAVAIEMWPDWVKNHEPRPWAYILPCPRGDIDVQGMEWMPTTEAP